MKRQPPPSKSMPVKCKGTKVCSKPLFLLFSSSSTQFWQNDYANELNQAMIGRGPNATLLSFNCLSHTLLAKTKSYASWPSVFYYSKAHSTFYKSNES